MVPPGVCVCVVPPGVCVVPPGVLVWSHQTCECVCCDGMAPSVCVVM